MKYEKQLMAKKDDPRNSQDVNDYSYKAAEEKFIANMTKEEKEEVLNRMLSLDPTLKETDLFTKRTLKVIREKFNERLKVRSDFYLRGAVRFLDEEGTEDMFYRFCRKEWYDVAFYKTPLQDKNNELIDSSVYYWKRVRPLKEAKKFLKILIATPIVFLIFPSWFMFFLCLSVFITTRIIYKSIEFDAANNTGVVRSLLLGINGTTCFFPMKSSMSEADMLRRENSNLFNKLQDMKMANESRDLGQRIDRLNNNAAMEQSLRMQREMLQESKNFHTSASFLLTQLADPYSTSNTIKTKGKDRW